MKNKNSLQADTSTQFAGILDRGTTAANRGILCWRQDRKLRRASPVWWNLTFEGNVRHVCSDIGYRGHLFDDWNCRVEFEFDCLTKNFALPLDLE